MFRVMHQSVTTTGTAGAGDDTTEDVAETGVTGVTTVSEDVSRDDIELTDTGNSQIVLDDTKLEEMTRISCKIDNKVHMLQLIKNTSRPEQLLHAIQLH